MLPYFNYMKPLVLSFPNTKHFLNKDCLHLLRSLCSRPPLFKSYNFWIFFLVVLPTANTGKLFSIGIGVLLNKGGSKSPPHKGGLQTSTSYVWRSFLPLYPFSSQAVVHSILHTKWWPSCVTFRMEKSKQTTNPKDCH